MWYKVILKVLLLWENMILGKEQCVGGYVWVYEVN